MIEAATNITVDIATVITGLAMVVVTWYYARLTKRLVAVTHDTFNCHMSPVIGIKIGKIAVGKEFGSGRRDMSIDIEVCNVGNAPAIDVLIDSEIQLRYASIQGESVIPARFEPAQIPFIKIDDEISSDAITQSYGNNFIKALQDEAREFDRLNTNRISTDPTKEPYKMSILRVYAYYRNAVGQSFRSCYEIEITVLNSSAVEDERFELLKMYIPRPVFITMPIGGEQQTAEIAMRNRKRDLCGW